MFVELEENIIPETDLEIEILQFWNLLKGKFLLNRKKVTEMIEILRQFKEKKTASKKGFYLGDESPPGSGKSTVLLLIVYIARKEGYTVVYVPDGTVHHSL